MNPITFYQAAQLSDEEVKSQFIVRKKEFERVISEVRRDDMQGSIQHYIFVGQRGSGKSTLLRRIQAEINADESLSQRLVAIYLSEEQAGIYRLHDLWDRVCQELREKNFEVEEVQWETYDKDLAGFANALYAAMQKALSQKGKKLVLLLDNIDRIFDSIKVSDTHLFREQLINYKDVRIVGGSTRLSEHFWQYDQPFYEFFQLVRLEPMRESELKELLIFWSDFLNEPALKTFVDNNPGKLNAVRILSDGMPRTMLSLVELFINKPDQHGYDYLRYILDRATPVYQERLGNLSPMQQKVALELSFFWDAAMVKELSQATRVDSKTLSALLGQLVEMQIVEKIPGAGKNFLYRLKERFFNLWLIMTQGGPRQKSQVKWLTIFLETWYEASELKTIYTTFTAQLAKGNVTPDRAVMMTKALAHSKCLSIGERDDLLDRTKTLIGNRKEHLEFLPPKAKEVFKKVFELALNKRLDEAQKELDSIEQDGDEKTLLQEIIYHLRGNQAEAEKYYLMAIEKGHVYALNNLANLYCEMNREAEAEKNYLMAIDNGVVDALYNLAILYRETNREAEAEKYYLMAIEKGHVDALYNLAILYRETNREAEAEKNYLMAIEKGHVVALNNLAEMLYSENRDPERAYSLIVQYNSSERKDNNSMALQMIIATWSGRPERLESADELLQKIVENKDVALLEQFIKEVLTHHQKNIVWQWFHHPKFGQTLKEMAKPLYFVTAKLLSNKAADTVLRSQPPELKETVDDIYTTIIERQQFYYGKGE